MRKGLARCMPSSCQSLGRGKSNLLDHRLEYISDVYANMNRINPNTAQRLSNSTILLYLPCVLLIHHNAQYAPDSPLQSIFLEK